MSRPVGRPREHDDRITTAFRLSPDLHRQLSDAATERDVSMNWLVTRALEDFLPRLIPVAELQLVRPPGDPTPSGGAT